MSTTDVQGDEGRKVEEEEEEEDDDDDDDEEEEDEEEQNNKRWKRTHCADAGPINWTFLLRGWCIKSFARSHEKWRESSKNERNFLMDGEGPPRRHLSRHRHPPPADNLLLSSSSLQLLLTTLRGSSQDADLHQSPHIRIISGFSNENFGQTPFFIMKVKKYFVACQ
ncbi:Protein of unknown function [Gryllus bimaculatus]|nr:Protein of unknown function [Gryllus bimaculatus]